MDDLYYKIYLNDDNVIELVHLQWFDEDGYNQDMFLSSKKFYYESDAVEYLQAITKSHEFGNLPLNIRVAITKFLGSMGVKNCLDRVCVDWDC